ncbi:MAG TPA: hypothetical protein ENJ01_05830 [Gammaproteobacteria bacterium]|nr:hypothetical protein [Gammaproteobacteria bacterium]
MKSIKTAILWILIGLLLGLWFGVNLGRDKPIYSNPFDADTLEDRARDAGEAAGELLEETGRAIRDTLKDE